MTVSPLTGMDSRRDSRAPASPPNTMPISVCASAKRAVRRTLDLIKLGMRSAKTLPGQWLHRKRRT